MRILSKPTEKGKEVFLKCIDEICNRDLKNRLMNCVSMIESAEAEFDNKVVKQQLHKLVRNKSNKVTKNIRTIGNFVTVNELKKVYTNQFAHINSPGRSIYDKLLLKAKYGKCPLCGHRNVSSLDHHLPKAYYPLLSVVPINLIPCCSDCNYGKLGSFPKTADEETLHPYYDNVENDLWLKATVQHTAPPSLYFFVDAPDSWDTLLIQRTKHHFRAFSLNKLYSIEAANELGNIKDQIEDYYKRDGSFGVKRFLQECQSSRSKLYLNSWQSAMYSALANDEWFCNGGFQ